MAEALEILLYMLAPQLVIHWVKLSEKKWAQEWADSA